MTRQAVGLALVCRGGGILRRVEPPADQPDGDGSRALRAELAAERAGTDHWRMVARQRTAALDELKHRPTVRVALAVERRLQPAVRRASAGIARVHRAGERTALLASALPARARGGDRRRVLEALEAESAPSTPVPVSVVVVGSEVHWRGALAPEASLGGTVEVVRVSPEGAPADPRADVEIAARNGEGAASAVRRGVEATTGEVVCVLAATCGPLAAGWLARLVAAVGQDDVVAAVPTLVHPARSLRSATPHDLLVREEGLCLTVEGGQPVVRSRSAGSAPTPAGRPPTEVDAGSATCLVVRRSAYDEVGGLPHGDDLDACAVELCARLRAQAGRIVHVPAARLLDARPVPTRTALVTPVACGGTGWRRTVERCGPLLARLARPSPPGTLRFTCTVASPSAKVAARWGDWHLAEGLAAGLGRLGHEVRVQTADAADSLAGRSSDVHLVLRGLHPVRATPGQRHVLWVISHPEAVEEWEYDEADLVLVASRRFADHVRGRTTTPVRVLLQATDHRRFRPLPPDPAHRHPLTVVAKTRGVLRPVVADAIAAGFRPALYGSGWEGLVDPGLVVATHVPNEELPTIYSSADVVLNDHWDTMRAWGFVSNRLFDVLACGTPVVSDHLSEIAELFGDAVVTYRSVDELGEVLGTLLDDPVAARERAAAGRERVLAAHTFDHRATELVAALDDAADAT
jgi:hypothetical protein